MSIVYRRFEARDHMPVYRMFRLCIQDYMARLDMVPADEQPDFDGLYQAQRAIYSHLEKTAAEDWVAVGANGDIVGWARAIERDEHFQLTHFFVRPDTQAGGVGRELLTRAFPPDRGRERSVIATTSPRALSLYLRHGVDYQGMAFCFMGKPRDRSATGDLEITPAPEDPETRRQILAIEKEVLGLSRAVDLDFFLREQPAFLARRDDDVVGYAFGSNGRAAGPAAALDPRDLPALLQCIESSAHRAGVSELLLVIPAMATAAVDWALESGYHIDPFHELLLSSSPMQLDRYLLTDSSFIW